MNTPPTLRIETWPDGDGIRLAIPREALLALVAGGPGMMLQASTTAGLLQVEALPDHYPFPVGVTVAPDAHGDRKQVEVAAIVDWDIRPHLVDIGHGPQWSQRLVSLVDTLRAIARGWRSEVSDG